MNAEACRRHGRRSASSGVPGVAPVHAREPWPRQLSNALNPSPNGAPERRLRPRRVSVAAGVVAIVAPDLPLNPCCFQKTRKTMLHPLVTSPCLPVAPSRFRRVAAVVPVAVVKPPVGLATKHQVSDPLGH